VVVYGAEGGGRELSKRETMSKIVSEKADYAIVTLSDPFDADPKEINQDIVNWLDRFGMKEGVNVWQFIDRREGIAKAVSLMGEGDVALFASKGAEQSIVFADRIEEWDDRVEVRKAIKNMLNNKL
jgi:UDP-N-acetylmuramyl tripeptide synthase